MTGQKICYAVYLIGTAESITDLIQLQSINLYQCLNNTFSGRLSKDEIDRMVNDAEKYKVEDDKQKDRITAKNQLESYSFNMKSTVEDENLKDKISEEDKKSIVDKCTEVISWLDSNQLAEKEEYEHKQKEMEAVCNPIVTKLYQAGGAPPGGPGAAGMPGGMPNFGAGGAGGAGQAPTGGSGGGPTIEEVD